jgi:NAD(P)-dependent dehydrogenase (short-subunit alcohol dehydrogenase family)
MRGGAVASVDAMAADLHGKNVVVTGASSGIGLETARALAGKGARVIMVVRSEQRGEAAIAAIKLGVPDARLELVLGDLYSLAETRKAGAEIRTRIDKLDVLVNNAGLIHTTRALTGDGLEKTFALNHLAAFLISYELRDLLAAAAPARIVTVSSMGHKFARVRWDDLPYCANGYSETRVYGNSKLCNIWFARESARRLAARGVTSNALHPGAVASNFGASGSALYRIGTKIARPFLLTSEKGARTSIFLASAPEVSGVSGEYFVRCKPATPSREARDDASASRLWQLSEQLCGVQWS